jgi:hypothetical protein
MADLLRVGSKQNRLLRTGLFVVVALVSVRSIVQLIGAVPFGVDLDIPLRAADRWANGGLPYLPSSFDVPAGVELPFLYPPFVLPILVPLLGLPHDLVLATWAVICLVVAVASVRRLGAPGIASVILILAWPPMFEGLLATNIQVVLFSAFVFLFWERGGPWTPAARPGLGGRWSDAGLGLFVGAVKVSQIHAYLYVLRQGPRRALVVGFVGGALVGLTVVVTGTTIWGDWLAQAARASNPAWAAIGSPISTFLGVPAAIAIAVASLATAPLVRSSRPGLWIAPLMLVASPTIQPFAWLFLLPGILIIRRELGLLAALLLAAHSAPAAWAAFLLVVGVQILAGSRGSLLEPTAPLGPARQPLADLPIAQERPEDPLAPRPET